MPIKIDVNREKMKAFGSMFYTKLQDVINKYVGDLEISSFNSTKFQVADDCIKVEIYQSFNLSDITPNNEYGHPPIWCNNFSQINKTDLKLKNWQYHPQNCNLCLNNYKDYLEFYKNVSESSQNRKKVAASKPSEIELTSSKLFKLFNPDSFAKQSEILDSDRNNSHLKSLKQLLEYLSVHLYSYKDHEKYTDLKNERYMSIATNDGFVQYIGVKFDMDFDCSFVGILHYEKYGISLDIPINVDIKNLKIDINLVIVLMGKYLLVGLPQQHKPSIKFDIFSTIGDSFTNDVTSSIKCVFGNVIDNLYTSLQLPGYIIRKVS